MKPWMDTKLFKLRWANTWFGDRQFELDVDGGPLRLWLAIYVPFIVQAVLAGIFQRGDDSLPGWAMVVGLGCYALAGFAYGMFRIEQFKRFASGVRLGGAWMSSTMRARDLLGPAVVYGLASMALFFFVATIIGFLWLAYMKGTGATEPDTLLLALTAFVAIVGSSLHGIIYDGYIVPRIIRHVAATLAFHGDLGLAEVGQGDRPIPGAGEGLAGVLDVGISV